MTEPGRRVVSCATRLQKFGIQYLWLEGILWTLTKLWVETGEEEGRKGR